MHIFDFDSSVQCDFNNACTAVASIEYAQCASHWTKSTFNHNARLKVPVLFLPDSSGKVTPEAVME